ncbi:MAG: NADPH-dependent FMN reductase [Candidatus Levybacteria bacterium]|nr:NADPH-dependent FMN reductase [Candidatus Levybacteria bacterium]
MLITLICGSIADKSHTKSLLKYIETLLKEQKVETVIWDLKEKPLSIAIPEFHKDPMQSLDKNVKGFVSLVTKSDGFVLGSPLYHGSYSGVLKNALDNLHYDAFRNKPVALVSNSSSIRNVDHPCEHLRLVVRALFGYALQCQIGTVNTDYEEEKDEYILTNEEIIKRCHRLTKELISFTSVLKTNAINK